MSTDIMNSFDTRTRSADDGNKIMDESPFDGLREQTGLPARRLILGAAVVILVGLAYFPLLLILSNSLRSGASLAQAGPFSLFTGFDVHNYRVAATGIGPYLINTVVVTGISVAIGVPVAALAAYGFATTRFRGREALFYLYLGLLLIPWTLTLIPLFAEVKTFGLFDNWGALVLPYATAAQPLLVFLNRAFFEGIPGEIIMSARVDGASELQVLRRIVAPLARPVLLMGVILMAIAAWGDYIWPQVVIPATQSLTVSAGLQVFIGGFGLTGHGAGAVYAAYVIATAPLLLLVGVSMKHFVEGVTSGIGQV